MVEFNRKAKVNIIRSILSTLNFFTYIQTEHDVTIFKNSPCSYYIVEVFEVACKIKQDIVIHPFAFRTHAHKLGKNVIFIHDYFQ